MSQFYEATVDWAASEGEDFVRHHYSRAHRWAFDGGVEVHASASPQIVRAPWSDPAGVDPEEGLVAALASCHMLFFLDLASRKGLEVVSYRDNAIAEMGRREDGKEAVIRATLRPEVRFVGETDTDVVAALHQRAHELCYIANSVNFPVKVEIA